MSESEYRKYHRYLRLGELVTRLYERLLPCGYVAAGDGEPYCWSMRCACTKRTGADCPSQIAPFVWPEDGGSAKRRIHEERLNHFADRTVCRHRLCQDGPRPECATCEGLPRHPYVRPRFLTHCDEDRSTPPPVMCRSFAPRALGSGEYLAVLGEPDQAESVTYQLRRLGDGRLPFLRACRDHYGPCYCVDGIPVKPPWFYAVVRDVLAFCERTGYQAPGVQLVENSSWSRASRSTPLHQHTGGDTHGAPDSLAYETLILGELTGQYPHRGEARCPSRRALFGQEEPRLFSAASAPTVPPAPFDRVRSQKASCQGCSYRFASERREPCRLYAHLAGLDGESDLASGAALDILLRLPCGETAEAHRYGLLIQEEADLDLAALAVRQASAREPGTGLNIDCLFTSWRRVAGAPESERAQAYAALAASELRSASRQQLRRMVKERLWQMGLRATLAVGPDYWARSAMDYGHERYLMAHPAVIAEVQDGMLSAVTIRTPHLLHRSEALTDLVTAALSADEPEEVQAELGIRLTADGVRIALAEHSMQLYSTRLIFLVEALHPDREELIAWRGRVRRLELIADFRQRPRHQEEVCLLIGPGVRHRARFEWTGTLAEALTGGLDRMLESIILLP